MKNVIIMIILIISTSLIQAQNPELVQITNTSDTEYHLQFSPDGTKIAYVNQYTRIRILNLEDNIYTEIIPIHEGGDLYIVWLNNQEIIFDTSSGLWKTSITGGEQILIKENASMPAISPDGSELVYSNQGNLYIMSTSGGTSLPLITNNSIFYFHPAWSNDNERIIFSSMVDSNKDLWSITSDGENLTQLTDDPENSEDRASWYPDENKITYTSYNSNNQIEQDIWMKNLDTSELTELTSFSGAESYPIWTSNAQKMAFTSNHLGQTDIWIHDYSELSISSNNKPTINKIYAYPNPFNPSTKINYELRITNYEKAEIVVYNSAGQTVWSSPITHHTSPVTGSILFDGSKFNSGIYYYSLIIDGRRMSSKSMILIK